MSISTITTICFSPTGGTRACMEAYCSRYPEASITHYDITRPKDIPDTPVNIDTDLVVLAAPVYEGHIPELAAERFGLFTGSSVPAVCLVSYGQVEFGASLYEFEGLAKDLGFIPTCSIAAVAHHSFANETTPLADGRPDAVDRQELGTIEPHGVSTPRKVDIMSIIMPSNAARILTKAPVADLSVCISCGKCVRDCPAGIIDPADYSIERSKCLRCFACVTTCPVDARRISYRFTPIVKRFLSVHDKHRIPVRCFTPDHP